LGGVTSQKVTVAANLDPQQVKAAVALADGATRAEAAAAANISDRQLYRWLEIPSFQQAIRDNLSEHIRRGRRLAFRTLINAMQGADPELQVRSADLILKHTAAEGVADTPAAATALVELVISKSREVEDACDS